MTSTSPEVQGFLYVEGSFVKGAVEAEEGKYSVSGHPCEGASSELGFSLWQGVLGTAVLPIVKLEALRFGARRGSSSRARVPSPSP